MALRAGGGFTPTKGHSGGSKASRPWKCALWAAGWALWAALGFSSWASSPFSRVAAVAL